MNETMPRSAQEIPLALRYTEAIQGEGALHRGERRHPILARRTGRAPAPSRLHCSVAVGLVDERLGPNGWWCTPPVGRMLYPEVRSAL